MEVKQHLLRHTCTEARLAQSSCILINTTTKLYNPLLRGKPILTLCIYSRESMTLSIKLKGGVVNFVYKHFLDEFNTWMTYNMIYKSNIKIKSKHFIKGDVHFSYNIKFGNIFSRNWNLSFPPGNKLCLLQMTSTNIFCIKWFCYMNIYLKNLTIQNGSYQLNIDCNRV